MIRDPAREDVWFSRSRAAAGVMDVEFTRLAAARRISAASVAPLRPLVEDRENAERWVRHFSASADGPADGVTARREGRRLEITPDRLVAGRPRIVYLHGGGMVYYSTAVFEPFLTLLATSLGTVVEAFDYLKAPEHSVEESLLDLAGRLEGRFGEGRREEPLVLVGDSVGGLLALYVALRVLCGAFARLVLIYPVLDLHGERASYGTFGRGYFLDASAMRWFRSFWPAFCGATAFDPFALTDADLAGLPRCTLVTAGCDVLRDEGFAWARHLDEHEVALSHLHFPDLPHDFCLYTGRVASARRAVEKIAEIIGGGSV
jgi:acetyl esterase